MFDSLTGDCASIQAGYLVLQTGGIGWHLCASKNTLAQLQEEATISVKIHLAVSENALTLFAFFADEERELFRRLIRVSGIGPTSAIGLLSSMPPEDLARAIVHEDMKALTQVKGIGKKTAERLLVELRDHLSHLTTRNPENRTCSTTSDNSELADVLKGLGFSPRSASATAQRTQEELGADTPLETLLRHALQQNI